MHETTATSWSLIAAAASGTPEARDRFARRYEPVVRAFLLARWRLADRTHDVDDAAADVMLACLESGGVLERATYRRAGGFRAFLFGVTRNVCAGYERRRSRTQAREVDLDTHDLEVGGSDPAAAEAFDKAWARSIIHAAGEEYRDSIAENDTRGLRRFEMMEAVFRDGATIRGLARRWETDADQLHHEFATARKEFGMALRRIVAAELGDGISASDVERECRDLLLLLQPS